MRWVVLSVALLVIVGAWVLYEGRIRHRKFEEFMRSLYRRNGRGR